MFYFSIDVAFKPFNQFAKWPKLTLFTPIDEVDAKSTANHGTAWGCYTENPETCPTWDLLDHHKAIRSFVSQNFRRSPYTRAYWLTGISNYHTKLTFSFLNPDQLRLCTCECNSNTGHKSTLAFGKHVSRGLFDMKDNPITLLGMVVGGGRAVCA
jgi:hypothetical protein